MTKSFQPFSLEKKKNGPYCMILNSKGLNESTEYVHFKMESVTCAIQNLCIWAIDLTDAYCSVPMAIEHRKYLRFLWKNTLYQYTCLPNGLAPSPRYFTKLLKPVYSTWSEGFLNVGYNDDGSLQGSTSEECFDNIIALRNWALLRTTKNPCWPLARNLFLGGLCRILL